MATVDTRFIVMQQEKARKLLLKTIVRRDVLTVVIMSPSKKKGLRKEAALRSKAVQANKAISARE